MAFPVLELTKPGHGMLFASKVIYQMQWQNPKQPAFPQIPACSMLWLFNNWGKKKKKREDPQPSTFHVPGKLPAHRKLQISRIYILLPTQKQLYKLLRGEQAACIQEIL